MGIPSPPAVSRPLEDIGSAIVRPDIRAAERLQGFTPGWTAGLGRDGHRWKMVGNAVTVNVAKWVGRRLAEPGEPVAVQRRPLADLGRRPAAAASVGGACAKPGRCQNDLVGSPDRPCLSFSDNMGGIPCP